MISLLPSYHETIVIPRSQEEVYELISAASTNKPFLQLDESRLFFNGWVRRNRFRLSLRTQRLTHYSPLMIGKIETTSNGCILFLEYKLFPNIRAIVTLSAILVISVMLFFYYQTRQLAFPLGGLFLLGAVFFIIRSNFMLQLRPLRDAMYVLLSGPPK